jgi:putative ABC transport system permease protein
LYENLYQSERVQLKLLYLFSGLAIIIAFIGLVGLTTYALKTRTKEMAIRKVMGASIPDLIRLIGREYLLVLLIGGSLAIPVSIYFLRQWLSTFAYRVDISPFTYLMTLAIAGLLLVVTISLQTFRSASASPADTLRDE